MGSLIQANTRLLYERTVHIFLHLTLITASYMCNNSLENNFKWKRVIRNATKYQDERIRYNKLIIIMIMSEKVCVWETRATKQTRPNCYERKLETENKRNETTECELSRVAFFTTIDNIPPPSSEAQQVTSPGYRNFLIVWVSVRS